MSNASDSTVDFFNAMLPHVTTEVRKSIESVQKILALFPGQTSAEIEKTIQSMLAGSRTTVPAMIQRAKDLIAPSTTEGTNTDTLATFLKDANKLDLADLKAIASGLSLPAGSKKVILGDLQRWVESQGAYTPPSAADLKRKRAQELLGDLPERMSQMTSVLAAEIIQRAEEAAKDKVLQKDGFEIFASLLLGIPLKGTKKKLLDEITAFVNRLAVSNAQTSAF